MLARGTLIIVSAVPGNGLDNEWQFDIRITGEKLNEELEAYLRRVPATTDDNTPYPIKGTKAIIAP